MKQQHISWSELTRSSYFSSLLPYTDRIFVDYTASNLHHAAIKNATNTLSYSLHHLKWGVTPIENPAKWAVDYQKLAKSLVIEKADFTKTSVSHDEKGKVVVKFFDAQENLLGFLKINPQTGQITSYDDDENSKVVGITALKKIEDTK